mmetsp:Transcript_29475/g.57763  ORF Transcript_29475/g.57763 Transcript_29475/m.57763 type:complete len:140 (+) Transcript_29475:3716-4135(+)
MRLLIALMLTALPAHAWQFTPKPICMLTHSEADTNVAVTYDHATRLYAISITTAQGWPTAPAFSIRFDGMQSNTISTRRHQTEGNTITVTDAGFANVLNGLEFNESATAFTATAAATVSLNGAQEPVQHFRDCTKTPVA